MASGLPQGKAGKVRILGVAAEKRAAVLPEVPTLPEVRTFTEAGLPGFEVKAWYGVLAPAGTPKAIIDKMSIEMTIILVMPDIQEYLAKQGVEPFISTPEQFAAMIKAELAKHAKIIKTAKIKLQ